MPRRNASSVLLMPRKHTRARGSQCKPSTPAMRLAACRKLAADLRREHAAGQGPVSIITPDGEYILVSRADAARSMDRAGDRWESQVRAQEGS